MPIDKPFHRIYRPVKEGHNSGYSDWAYIVDKSYAQNPDHYTRAYYLIQNDLIKLFEYVEPADNNLKTYSFRIHELFMRTCIELEANFKAILRENIYTPTDKNGKLRAEKDWNIYDYKKVNNTHHLYDYTFDIPIWNGLKNTIRPFKGG